MIKLKSLLAENMRRFHTKNLHEDATKTITVIQIAPKLVTHAADLQFFQAADLQFKLTAHILKNSF
jgi:glucose-6-phosphate-specific signal transduction histidine kinase